MTKAEIALNNVTQLCLDSSPIIYLIEQHPIYFSAMQEIVQITERNTIALFSSTLTLTEVLNKPLKANDTNVIRRYYRLLERNSRLTLSPITTKVAKSGALLRAKYNLKTPDALQIAVAIETGCDTFLTNDFKLAQVKEINVLVLDQLL